MVVDKTMLIADVLDSGYTATLFCRPRRFGKTLNMTMMKAFFEISPEGRDLSPLFEGTEIWDADGGRYREHQGAYPVVHMSFNTVKKDTWEASYGEIKGLIANEYRNHDYLLDSDALSVEEVARYRMVLDGSAPDSVYARSLAELCRLLRRHHHRPVVLLVDEYDAPAPVMAGYSASDGGYYRDVVSFLKGWLTDAIKDGGEGLAFACLTGVQPVTKESIFSDLNNLVVSTALDGRIDGRFGFTDAEVQALAAYLGHSNCMDEARVWYDGYRFGSADVYNPWSMLNYFKQGCARDVYWGNTSSHSVIRELVSGADEATLQDIYDLMEPGGTVSEPLDLGIVFPEMDVQSDAIWSMLYLAGYLTTEDTGLPNNTRVPRRLRIPNREVAELYRGEIVERFALVSGGRRRLSALHDALIRGNADVAGCELSRIARDSASVFDLTSENGFHMLLLRLLFGMNGYADPESNREYGFGRPDIRIEPMPAPFVHDSRPLLTIEVKFSRDADDAQLADLSHTALAQIEEKGYDAGELPAEASGRVRWGIASSGKRIVATCERVD